LRAEALAKALAKFLQDASRTLGVNFSRYLDRKIVTIVAAAHWPAERVRILLSAGLTAAGPAIGTGPHPLLLHRLRQTLCTFAHGVQRTALAIDRTVGISLTKLTFGLAHCLPGVPELAHFVPLALLARLAEPMLAELVKELVEPVTQALLVLP
jgi:hypothetical protein